MVREAGYTVGYFGGIGISAGHVEFIAGDINESARLLQEAYDGLSRLGERGFLSTVAAMLARAKLQLGDITGAEGYALVCRDLAAADARPPRQRTGA